MVTLHRNLLAVAAAMLLAPLAQAAETTITAIHATGTGATNKSYDDGSRHFRHLLVSLDYNRFETVASKHVDLSPGGKLRVEINSRYSLSFSGTELQSDGHVKTVVRVFGVPRQAREPVEVLEVNVRLAPDKPIMIRGLRMDEGEIVLFLNLD